MATPGRPLHADPAWSRPDVLIVDDDPGICTLLITVLRRAGYSCAAVASGVDAIPAIESEQPNVVLLDLMLPHLSGAEVLGVLRESKPEVLPCVIVITAASKNDLHKVDSFRDDIFRLIRKPFDLGELTAAVRECSQRQRSADA